MDFRDALSTELPAPRDDEPSGLRQEILDELADHLACSYNRELLRGANPGEARRRVIERFGDPAAVARRLWLDAMRGRIMTRRFVIATCLVVSLASLSVAGVMWRQTAQVQRDSARAVAEAIRLMSDQSEKARASQQALLEQLHEMSETIRSTKSLDWNPVSIKLTEETADGPPVAGAEITLTEWQFGGGSGQGGTASAWNEVATRVTDRSGIADLGLVRPGDYSFHVTRSWDQGSELASGQFKIEPGSRIDKRIVCPKVPLGRVPVRVRLAWPADLAKENLALYATFTPEPITRGELSWTISDDRPSDRSSGLGRSRMPRSGAMPAARRSVLLGPGTAMAQVRPSREAAYLWTSPMSPVPSRWLRAEVSSSDLREIKELAEAIEFEQGTYRLSGILVLRPSQPNDAKGGRRSFEVVIASQPFARGILANPWWVWDRPLSNETADGPRTKAGPSPKGGRLKARGDRPQQLFPLQQLGRTDLVLPWESWRVESGFEARPGQVNEWTIALSDELLDAVRKRLKTEVKVEGVE
jgi:hypothetical protein